MLYNLLACVDRVLYEQEEAQQAYSRQEIDIDTPIQILKS